MAYIVMACVVMACVVVACVAMPCLVMAYLVMAYVVMAYVLCVGEVEDRAPEHQRRPGRVVARRLCSYGLNSYGLYIYILTPHTWVDAYIVMA